MPARGLGEDLVVKVDGEPITSHGLDEAVLTTELERTIMGASTLTIKARDPDKILLRSGFFERAVEAVLDGMPFMCCAFDKRSDEYTLKFEDRVFALLRKDKKPRRGSRANETLAQFVHKVIKEVCGNQVTFVCPEERLVQPVKGKKPSKKQKREAAEGRGVGTKDFKMADGQAPSPEQRANVEAALRAINETNAPEEAAIALLEAGLAETAQGGFINTELGPEGAVGVFQMNPHAQPASIMAQAKNVNAISKIFLESGFSGHGGANALARAGKKAGQIALEVEEPAQNANFFEQHRERAREILQAGGGTAGKASRGSRPKEKVPHQWELNQNLAEEPAENTLMGLERLAQEGNWRFFVTTSPKRVEEFHFIHDSFLSRAKPILTIDEETDGVTDIAFELDKNEHKKPAAVEVEARAPMWFPEPGSCIALNKKTMGPLGQGRWIVSKIERRDITDPAVTITLSRPENAKAEAADEERDVPSQIVQSGTSLTGNQQIHQGGTKAGTLKEDSHLFNLLFQANWISQQKFIYVWGGGHLPGSHGRPDIGVDHVTGGPHSGAQVGYDCSGAVSSLLIAAGIDEGHGVMATTGLESWGQEGVGHFFTVWVRPEPHGHTFATFNVSTKYGPLNTGGVEKVFVFHGPGGKVENGWSSESKSGFKPRNYPGL